MSAKPRARFLWSALALLAACALAPRPARAQTGGNLLRPTTAVVVEDAAATPLVTNASNAFDGDTSTTATISVDLDTITAVTADTAFTTGGATLATVEELTTESPAPAIGVTLVDASDPTLRDPLQIQSVDTAADTITFTSTATQDHAAGAVFRSTAGGRAIGGTSLAGNTPNVQVKASSSPLSAGVFDTLTLLSGQGALLTSGDRLVDRAVAVNETLTVQSIAGDVVTLAAAPTQSHAGNADYAVARTRREPPDLAVEYGRVRQFPGGDTFDLQVLPGDTVTLSVTVDADTSDVNRASAFSTNSTTMDGSGTGSNADDLDADGTNDTPNLVDEWVIEAVFDSNGDGRFDARDVDLCDSTDANIGGVSCGVVEIGRVSTLGVLPHTFGVDITSFVIAAQAEGTFDLNEDFWVRVRSENIPNGTAASTLDISDIQMLVTFDFGSSNPNLTVAGLPLAPLLRDQTPGTAPVLTATCTGCTQPMTWTTTAGRLPPGMSATVSGASGETYTINGTPIEAGDWAWTVFIDGGAVTATYNIKLPVDGLEIDPSGLPLFGVGEAFDQTITARIYDANGNRGNAGGNPGAAGVADWSLGASDVVPPGMSFSPGPVVGTPLTNALSTTLSGMWTGNPYSFTLTVADATIVTGGAGDAAEQTAYTATLEEGSNRIRIIPRSIPNALQGMIYSNDTAIFPALKPLATIQAVNPVLTSGATNVQWTVTDPGTDADDVGPDPNVLELTGATTLTPSIVSANPGPLTPVPVDDAKAGTYNFRLKVTDNNDNGKFDEEDFTFRVPERRTVIRAAPPPVVEVDPGGPAIVTFTVFAEGGVPTADTDDTEGSGDPLPTPCPGTPCATGTCNTATGECGLGTRAAVLDTATHDPDWEPRPRYRLQYAVDTVDNSGTPVTNWIPLTDIGNTGGWPHATAPVSVNIDLENDAGITDNTLKPSAGTGRKYTIRFLAEDGVARGVDGLTATPMSEDSYTIEVVAASGADTNPEPTRPTRLRQERFD